MTAHTDVGAYAMGLLEERDRREFEDHLAGCPACAAEVAELSPMAALLKGVELRGVELTGVEPAGAEGGEPVAGGNRAAGTSPSCCAAGPGGSGNAGAGRSRWGRRPASC